GRFDARAGRRRHSQADGDAVGRAAFVRLDGRDFTPLAVLFHRDLDAVEAEAGIRIGGAARAPDDLDGDVAARAGRNADVAAHVAQFERSVRPEGERLC